MEYYPPTAAAGICHIGIVSYGDEDAPTAACILDMNIIQLTQIQEVTIGYEAVRRFLDSR